MLQSSPDNPGAHVYWRPRISERQKNHRVPKIPGVAHPDLGDSLWKGKNPWQRVRYSGGPHAAFNLWAWRAGVSMGRGVHTSCRQLGREVSLSRAGRGKGYSSTLVLPSKKEEKKVISPHLPVPSQEQGLSPASRQVDSACWLLWNQVVWSPVSDPFICTKHQQENSWKEFHLPMDKS